MASSPEYLRVETVAGSAGAPLKVAAPREPVVSLRDGEARGWRFAPVVLGDDRPVSLAALDWGDAEVVDFTALGLVHEALREHAGPVGMVLAPVSFSTLASRRARTLLAERLAEATAETGAGLVLEVRGLKGVPSERLRAVVAEIRPACAGVVAEAPPDAAGLAPIGHCGFAGVHIRVQGPWSAEPQHLARYQTLTDLARGFTPFLLARAPEADHDILAAAGFTHAVSAGMSRS